MIHTIKTGLETYTKVEPVSVDQSDKQFFELNFTITFNPHKFSDVDTLWDGPCYFAKYINKVRYFHSMWFVFESHKNGRRHLHGQMKLKVPQRLAVNRFDTLTNISKWCNSRLGRSDFYWNNSQIRDSDYPTWYDYCVKENPSHMFWVYQDDPTVYQKQITKQ